MKTAKPSLGQQLQQFCDSRDVWEGRLSANPAKGLNQYVPSGHESLFDAVENVARALFPSEWTGTERAISASKMQQATKIFRKIPGSTGLMPSGGELLLAMNLARSDAELDALLIAILRRVIEAKNAYADRVLPKVERSVPPLSSITNRSPRGKISVEEHRAARRADIEGSRDTIINWCNLALAELPEVGDAERLKSETVKRRERAEQAVRDALYSSDALATSPEIVRAYFLNSVGEVESILPTEWGTPRGLDAIQSPPPGIIDYGKFGRVAVLLPQGELTKTAQRMLDKGDDTNMKPSDALGQIDGRATGQKLFLDACAAIWERGESEQNTTSHGWPPEGMRLVEIMKHCNAWLDKANGKHVSGKNHFSKNIPPKALFNFAPNHPRAKAP